MLSSDEIPSQIDVCDKDHDQLLNVFCFFNCSVDGFLGLSKRGESQHHAAFHRFSHLYLMVPPSITWNDLVVGTVLFTIPQIPLTIGNAVIAIVAENNELFPDRKVTERGIAVSQGIMNLVSPLFGGIPMCHGAGGMAGHVRFGARTGGALVILGSMLVLIALFFSDSVAIIFKIFPNAILGVILFFAGSELAIVVKDIGDKKADFYVMLIVAAFAMWNMGAAFLAGVILDNSLRRGWIKI